MLFANPAENVFSVGIEVLAVISAVTLRKSWFNGMWSSCFVKRERLDTVSYEMLWKLGLWPIGELILQNPVAGSMWLTVSGTWTCIDCLRANASNALRYGSHSVCVTCKQHHICFYCQSQSIIALWPVLIAPTHGRMARLSLPGWLVRLR